MRIDREREMCVMREMGVMREREREMGVMRERERDVCNVRSSLADTLCADAVNE